MDKIKYITSWKKDNVTRIVLEFNNNNPDDIELLEYLNHLPGSRTANIKEAIRFWREHK